MRDVKQITFPAITVKIEEEVAAAAHQLELRSSGVAAVEEHYFRGLHIYDSAGQRHRVEDAHEIRGLKRFAVGLVGLLLPVRFGPCLSWFQLAPPEPFSLEELRALVAAHYRETEGEESQEVSQVLQAETFADLYAVVRSAYLRNA